jgi:predicted small metal-binding protein
MDLAAKNVVESAPDFAFSFTSHSYPRLEECKQRFVKHWNEKHQMNKIEKDSKKTAIA